MSSLVVFSFWCVLEGDSIFIFKTTFLSSTVSQGIRSLSFSPSPLHDCFKYFFHDNSSPKLYLKYKNIKYSPNCYSKPAKCSMSPFWSSSDCFYLFYSLLGWSCVGCLSLKEWIFPDQLPFLFLDLGNIRLLSAQIKKPWCSWSQISKIWLLNHYMLAAMRCRLTEEMYQGCSSG